MFKYIIYFILIFSSGIFAKDKYFVYFTGKTSNNNGKLLKGTTQYNEAINLLSEKSLFRREKHFGAEVVDETDIPINPVYIDALEKLGAQIVWKLRWFNSVSCYLDDDIISEIKALEFVDRIVPVGIIRYKRDTEIEQPDLINNSLRKTTELNYGLSLEQYELSDVPLLHEYGITGRNVTIGLLDAGFDYAKHPALDHINVIATKDFVYGDDDVSNDNDATHGTNVLGMTAGYEEGELIGPAYNADFVLAKTEDIRIEVNVEEDNFVAGVQWVEALGVDIISTSLGYNEFDKGEDSYSYEEMDGRTAITTRALDMAFNKGVLTISSAGNEGNKSWIYITSPGDGFNTITVGSVTKNNTVASFSSRGPTADGRIKPEVMAVGVNCYSATPGKNAYKYINGTSVSAPIVAGIAGQLLSAYPHLTNKQMRQIIIESGDNVQEPDNDRGYGLVSAVRAVSFPNLSVEDDKYTINKMFIGNRAIDPSSVYIELVYSDDNIGNAYIESEDGISFKHELELFNIGDTVKFRYGYKDLDGASYFDSGNNYYSFVYGQTIISRVVADKNNIPLVDKYELYQNYPNPFNPTTTISFYIAEAAHVKIKLYNMLGEHIVTLLDENREEGYYSEIIWNGLDKHGRKVSSGPYIYQLIADKQMTAKKMIFLK